MLVGLQGNLTGGMAVLKGTPTTYNKDNQEIWELLFNTLDTTNDTVRIATGVLSTVKIFPERMRCGLSADMLATDLAEYLVRKVCSILGRDVRASSPPAGSMIDPWGSCRYKHAAGQQCSVNMSTIRNAVDCLVLHDCIGFVTFIHGCTAVTADNASYVSTCHVLCL